MENKKLIIIIALIGVIIVLSGLITTTLLKEPTKTVELFENGTTIEVPVNTALKSHDEFSTIYITEKNTTIIGIDNNNLAGALVTQILSNVIVDAGTKQDNGLYKLDKNSVMEIGDKLGLGYDENNILEGYIGIKHNNTINQSIIIISADEQEIINILNSIHWKQGSPTNATTTAESSTSSTDKTYPFYGGDGSLVGYYHVGDVVEDHDGLYQLQSNGQWVCIGTAASSPSYDYEDDYDDDYDSGYYNYDHSSSVSSNSGGSSDSGNVEVTTDDYY